MIRIKRGEFFERYTINYRYSYDYAFAFVVFQSCGAYATVKSSNGIGNIGIMISFVALIVALIYINTRDAYSGAFISAVFYALAGFLGLFNFTNHKIVFVYGFMFIMFSIFSVLIGIKQKNASN